MTFKRTVILATFSTFLFGLPGISSPSVKYQGRKLLFLHPEEIASHNAISLDKTLLLSQSQPKSQAKANQYLQQGIEQYQANQIEAAIQSWQQALTIYQEIDHHEGKKIVLSNLGAAQAILKNYQQAIDYLQPSLTLARELGDRHQEKQTLNNLSIVYSALGNYDKVIEHQQQHLTLAQELSDSQGVAHALNSLGNAHRALGQYSQAIDYHQKHLKLAKELKDLQKEGAALGNLGLAYYDLGQYTKAMEFHQQTLIIARLISDRQIEANAMANLGITHRVLGNYVEAIEYQQQALEIEQELDNRQDTGEILRNLGNVYTTIGEYGKAIEHQQQSLTIMREMDNLREEGLSLTSLGATYAEKGEYVKAIEYYQQSLTIAQEFDDRKGVGYIFTNLGVAYHALKDHNKAIKYYQKSLEIAQNIGDRWLEGEVLANLGFLNEELGVYEKALEYYNRGLAIFEAINAPQQKAMTLNNRAHTLLKWGKFEEAEKNLRVAVQILDSLRTNLDDTSQVSLFDTQVFTYNLFQQVLVAQNQPEKALEMSENGRARVFMGLLSKQVSSNPEISDFNESTTIGQIREIAQLQNATMVEYSIVPQDDFIHQGKQRGKAAKLYIWVVQPTGEVILRQVDLSSLDTSLKELVQFSRESIGVRSRGSFEIEELDGPSQTQQLQQLHQILIQPIADLLPQEPEERVIFSPQESLFFVPFPALQDDQGRYLIEKHTISTAPAIQALELTRQQKAKVLTAAAEDILVVGNPTMPKVSTQIGETPKPLDLLLGAETEALEIAKLFKTKAFINDQAKEIDIVQQMPQAKIIHLATHGLLDDFTGQGVPGAIALAPSGTGELNDGLLTANEILELKLNADLVVLSACDTGLGNITGDGVIGLSRSLFIAGTPSVVVSLWKVPDAPTAMLMTEFYRSLQEDELNKAQALRQAMLKTMEQHPEPKNWAAFTLIGEAE